MIPGFVVVTSAQVSIEKREEPPMEQLPQEQNQLAVNYNDEIKEQELPEGIRESVRETYPAFKMTEIFRGSDGSYKINLEQNEQKLAAYYNAMGKFLRIEKNNKEEETINDDWR